MIIVRRCLDGGNRTRLTDLQNLYFGEIIMRRILAALIILLPLFSFGSALAKESPRETPDPIAEVYSHSLTETLFIVETDEESARESLNRVSGEIDLGFSSPEQTYQSDHHTKVDPLKEPVGK